MLALILAADPPAESTGAVVYGLAIALIGALSTTAFQFYKYRKQAGREDDSLIAAATGEAINAAKVMLEAYRVELQRARDDLDRLRVKLEDADKSIARLEGELRLARDDRTRLYKQLEDAIERRAMMQQQMEEMRRRMGDLERVVSGSLAREELRSGAWTADDEVIARAKHGPTGTPRAAPDEPEAPDSPASDATD
jgi:septal ring factor EnvC (AmiA/AmiB activator)